MNLYLTKNAIVDLVIQITYNRDKSMFTNIAWDKVIFANKSEVIIL